MNLATPPHFSLDFSARSSWVSLLPPLSYNPALRTLRAALSLETRRAVDVEVQEIEHGQPLHWRVIVSTGDAAGPLSAAEQAEVESLLHAMLGLDEDLSCFYFMTDQDPELAWAREQGAGRFLRSPTTYEDLAKALVLGRYGLQRAQRVIGALCDRLGERTPSGRQCFPSASKMRDQPLSFYQEIGATLVGKGLIDLAERTTSGSFYPDSMRRGPARFLDLPTMRAGGKDWRLLLQLEMDWEERLRALVGSFKGFGDRSTELMMPLVGCFDGFFVDRQARAAWRRRRLARRGKRRAQAAETLDDQQIIRQMEHRTRTFLHYRGLVLRLLLSPVDKSPSQRPAARSRAASA